MTGPDNFNFKVLCEDGPARLGEINCAHGLIETPAFMPVGTAGTVKAMTPEGVKRTGAQIILGNTYHLMLRPGAERIASLGGLHKFMNWPGPILTDSGGYQVFSLAQRRKLDEKGVLFQSHIDGASVELTPERSIEIQNLLDADISMVLDECTEWPVTESRARESLELSMKWAIRSKNAFRLRPGYGLFGIVQGSIFENLRQKSAEMLMDIGFDGYAVGGLAVGEGQAQMFDVLDFTVPHLPEGKPRYLMGVGRPQDIVGAVSRGIDMFDCVMPTRSGRTAQAFVRGGTLNLRNAIHSDDDRPLDLCCTCPTCNGYSRAYLHHLVKAGEMLAGMLLTSHNLHYYQEIMRGLRHSIKTGMLSEFCRNFFSEIEDGPVRALTA